MPLISCHDCGRQISDAAPACIGCGRPISLRSASQLSAPPVLPTAPTVSVSHAGSAPIDSAGATPLPTLPLFPVSVFKFVVLSVCSFGLYELYWFYKNWQRIAVQSSEKLSPFMRAFWSVFWSFSMFNRIKELGIRNSVPIRWSAGLLGSLYFVLALSWRLPDPWWLVSILSFLPFLPVVGSAAAINARVASDEAANTSFSRANVAMVVIGGPLLALAVYGTLFPD